MVEVWRGQNGASCTCLRRYAVENINDSVVLC